MGLTKKSDGRYVVGKGIADGNEYKGSAAWRDMVIQYSGDGATEKSLEYLTFLKDYALYHSAQGNPVIPPNVQIWMSTANTMKAVEADDVVVDGDTVKIGSCTWDGSAWSFSEPTPGGGSSLPQVTSDDNGDVLAVVDGKWSKAPAPSSLPTYTESDKGKNLAVLTIDGEPVTTAVIPQQSVTADIEMSGMGYYGILSNVDISKIVEDVAYTITVDGTEYEECYFASGKCIIPDVPCGFMVSENELRFLAQTSGDTHTVSAVSVIIPEEETAEWTENPLIVNISLSGGVYSADKTFEQLKAAERSNIPIFMSLGRWGFGLAQAEWYNIGEAYTANLLHSVNSGGNSYLEYGMASYSENGFTMEWTHRVQMTAN